LSKEKNEELKTNSREVKNSSFEILHIFEIVSFLVEMLSRVKSRVKSKSINMFVKRETTSSEIKIDYHLMFFYSKFQSNENYFLYN